MLGVHKRCLWAFALIPWCVACTTWTSGAPPPVAPNAALTTEPVDWQSIMSLDWFAAFQSDELSTLLRQGASANLEGAAAEARVRQAAARVRMASASLVPSILGGISVSSATGGTRSENSSETDWSALISASYEVDFWGRNRALRESARATAQAARADRDIVQMTTLTGIANTYFLVLSYRERLAVAEANLQAARTILQVIEARYRAGVAGPIELATQRAAVANAEIVVPTLQQSETEARAALALLVNRDPAGFDVSAASLTNMVTPGSPAQISSGLIARRPDVVRSERDLAAAHADVLAARAALLPSFTLNASGGAQSPALQAAVTTLAGSGYTLGLGASLVQTLFDAGKRRAADEEALAREQELLANYGAALLSGLRDIQVALAAQRHLDDQADAQQRAVQESGRAFEGAQLRYRAGSGDFLTVLEAQRAMASAGDQNSQYRLARLQASLNLYKAIGGGWPER